MCPLGGFPPLTTTPSTWQVVKWTNQRSFLSLFYFCFPSSTTHLFLFPSSFSFFYIILSFLQKSFLNFSTWPKQDDGHRLGPPVAWKHFSGCQVCVNSLEYANRIVTRTKIQETERNISISTSSRHTTRNLLSTTATGAPPKTKREYMNSFSTLWVVQHMALYNENVMRIDN